MGTLPIYLLLFIDLYIFIYIYICMHVCVCMCVYVHIYIYTEKDAVRPCVLHCFPCSILQCFSSCSVFTSSKGHNRPQYAKIGHKGLNKQKTKKTKKNEKTKKKQKKQRFLETVGIGGMSLVFLVFLVFLFFFVFFCFFGFFGFPAFPQINFFLRTSLCLFPHFGMKEPFVNNKIRFLRGTSLN